EGDGEEVLDALVEGDELLVGERPVAFERRRVGARADAVEVQRGPADARGLQDQPDALAAPDPRALRAVGGAPAQAAGGDRAHVVLETGEVAVGVEPGTGLEEEDLRALFGELLGDDRAAAARADDDDVRARVHRYSGTPSTGPWYPSEPQASGGRSSF